jgi:hypothetical protein
VAPSRRSYPGAGDPTVRLEKVHPITMRVCETLLVLVTETCCDLRR